MEVNEMSIWDTPGRDKYYEHCRNSSHSDLRKWVDEAYVKVAPYLDNGWVDNLRNGDFYSRLWELELAEWFILTGLRLIPTNGIGFDFCIELEDGLKVWIEAVYSYPDDELKEIEQRALASDGEAYDVPREQVALRYSSSLFHKANKIKEKYLSSVGENDRVLIAISSFGPGAGMWKDRDIFQLAILPINFQLVHFSTNGEPLDPTVPRPSHQLKTDMTKATGVKVKKEFLYPGTEFPYVDGVMFSEASNLQQLLGTSSTSFGKDTNTPHIYPNYSGKEIPESFTKFFYYHKWRENQPMMSLDTISPEIELM
ncbi:MAG TPA: hypothetical protein VL362_01430 [Patescibacteria group bacterium]|jgi:hypothetical protein|nr:hypothetical protein [Patescibacteria group bacterium]